MSSNEAQSDIQTVPVKPSEIIIEEESNHSHLKGNSNENKSNDNLYCGHHQQQQFQENKGNDEYKDDYDEEEGEECQFNSSKNKVKGDEKEEESEDKPEHIEIEKEQYQNEADADADAQSGEEEEEHNNEDQRNQIEEREMESISEAEIEEDHRQQKTNSQSSNVAIQEDYNQVFDDIIRKNKQNLIFKAPISSNQFKPLTMMKRRDPNTVGVDSSSNCTSQKQKCYLKPSANSINSAPNLPKAPIEFTLFDEAKKRREKIEKVEYNNLMKIILTASKAKISTNSQKIAISKTEKKIEEVISRRERNKHLTFIAIGEVLTELNIFREIMPKSNSRPASLSTGSAKRIQTYQSYKEIQKEMINVKENEKRKLSEINFYEQFWLMINPGNKQEIKADMISEIMKILFAPINANVKDISEILKQFLMTAFFLNCNPEEVKKYSSPITEKDIAEEDIWPIEKVVREFLLLKENILAYQSLKHFNKAIQNEIAKNEKEITFKPSIIGFGNGPGPGTGNSDKGQKRNYYEERLPSLIEREHLRHQVLEEMKKESEEADLKECTFKPEINPYHRKAKSRQMKISPGNTADHTGCIFDRLYASNKGKDERLKLEKEELNKQMETQAMAECFFHPKLISRDSYQNSFANSEYPKGFQEYVAKMQHGIIEAQKKKYNEKRIPRGENYEKVRQANIQPFNITDMQKKGEAVGDKKGSNNYFTIQVKIPSGKERTLKIFLNDDPYDVAESFCKTYCFKDEIKERLAKTILSFRTIYLQRNHIEEH